MIRLNLFMIWFLHFLSLLSVICRYYRQNSSSRIIAVLVYTVSTLFFIFCPIGGKWVMVKLFSMKTIDSGAILKSYVDSHGISPKWLALQLNCHRTNLYKIFKKQHLDTFTILKFSEVLEHNFFEDIAVQYTNSQISTDSLPNE